MEQSKINSEQSNILSAAEAAGRLRVTKQTVVRWLKLGLIDGFKVGYGIRAEWRIEASVVEKMKKYNQVVQP